ncbi:MAG: hypothetical protein U1F29_17890 [Planctomycetota bacterium]
MSPQCRDLRLRWLEHAAPTASSDDAFVSHMLACSDCAEFARRALRLRRAFGELERFEAPAELPGRVVAACNAGFLQDRAAALLQSMGRIEAPAVLDQKVLGVPAALRAPQVLERLVDEELRDPSRALARRFAGRLERLSPPDELAARVESELARPRPDLVPDARERAQALRWVVASLVVIVSLALGVWYGGRESHANAKPALAFRIEHVRDARELGSMGRTLAGGFTGGWSEIAWEEAR